jgi:hypothetical protein
MVGEVLETLLNHQKRDQEFKPGPSREDDPRL